MASTLHTPAPNASQIGDGARRWLAGLTAAAVVAAAVLLPNLVGAISAAAAEGPAPSPREYRVLETEHSDTIATFWDDGEFNLGSKADVDGSLAVRFPADGILVHVNDLAKYDGTWPAGYEFVAESGSTVWLAPQSRKDGVVWPGFSTESVPSGVLNGNITFTLDSVTGPGEVEAWTSDAFGQVQERLWSSDEAITSFTRPINTHLHANWAFTQPGTYQLTVTASATTNGGAAVADTKTYTFVAGPLAEQVTTSIGLHVHGESTVTEGAPVELHATITPATAEGYVEFRNGSTVLGHVEAEGGEAELETTSLGIGTHSITAHFVPKVANFATASDADPVTITVTDATGVPFSISGLQESYRPGDTMTLQVVGAQLSGNQSFSWTVRKAGGSELGWRMQSSTSATYTVTADASMDDYEIIALWCPDSSGCSASESWLAKTDPVRIVIDQELPRPTIAMTSPEPGTTVYKGDEWRLEVTGLELAEGETVQYVARTGYGRWLTSMFTQLGTVTNNDTENHVLEGVVTSTLALPLQVAAQVVSNGIVVRQSAPIDFTIGRYGFLFSGLDPLYWEGSTLRVNAEIDPIRAQDDFTYQWWFSKASNFSTSNPSTTAWSEMSSEMPTVVERLVNVQDHNNGYLRLRVYKDGEQFLQSSSLRVYVTNDPDAQLFSLAGLSAHYHQGDTVRFSLTAFPEPQSGDKIIWEWKWPGLDWMLLPGATGTSHTLMAEQALDGVEVRVRLVPEDPADEPLVSETRTIRNDDHGVAARQASTITGTTAVSEGDTVMLSRELPLNGQTILTEHRWERLTAGVEEWTVIEDQTGAGLLFPAALADNGAQYRVSILKPTGDVAYGPSPAVTLTVQAGTPAATAPETPAQPGVTAHGSTVSATWLAPADGGSPITGYTVTLTPASGHPITQSASADATSAMFMEVPEGTWTATVVAANEVGSSPASPASLPVTVTVDEEPEPEPEPVAPQAPAQPGITADGTTVSVTWIAPADGGSAITGYTVTLTPESGDPITQSAAADATSARFTEVPEGTYTATVVAANEISSSQASAASASVTVIAPELEPEPEPTVPRAPAAPTAEVDGSTVTASWVAPADGGSPITGYTVTLTGNGEPIVQQLGADATTAIFTKVPAGTYAATVVTVNAKGSSDASPASNEVTVKAADDGDPGEEPGDQVTPAPDSELTVANRGGVDVPDAATRGQQITVKVGQAHAGGQVRVWLHSTPVLLGTVKLDANGNTQVTIPSNAALGDHKIVVQSLDGSLIGWDGIKMGTASQVGPNGEWLADTGVDAGLLFPLAAGGAMLLLLGAVILMGTAKRRRGITNPSAQG